MFHVGQKVVCVNALGTDSEGIKELSRGAIYTVRWHGIHGVPYFKPTYCVRVEGIVRFDDWAPLNQDCPFRASRFRPVIERRTSIEIFTAMLKPSKVEA